MIKDLPSWFEAGGLLVGTLVAAVAVSSVTLYRLDSLEDKVDKLIIAVSTVNLIKRDVEDLKSYDRELLRVIEKFSESVDKLSLAVARMEVKQDLQGNHSG